MSAPRLRLEEPPLRLAAEMAATTVFWGLWFYVIAPLLSLVLWFAGYQVFVEQMITLGGYETFLQKLTAYGLVVLAIMLATFAWVAWNQRRYGAHRNTRTRAQPAVTLSETAAAAGLDLRAVHTLRRQRRLVIGFDERNRLLVLPRNKGKALHRL